MTYELFGPDNKFANVFSGLNVAKTSETASSSSFEVCHYSSQRSFSSEIKKEYPQSDDALFFKFLLSEEEKALLIQEEQMKKLESSMDDCEPGRRAPSQSEIETKPFEHVPFRIFSCSPPLSFVQTRMPQPIHPPVTLTMLPQNSSTPIPKSEPTKKILLELKNPRTTIPSTHAPLYNVQAKPRKILLELKNPYPRRVFSSVYDI